MSQLERQSVELKEEKSGNFDLSQKLANLEAAHHLKCNEAVELSNILSEKTRHFEQVCRDNNLSRRELEQGFEQRIQAQAENQETILSNISEELESKIKSLENNLGQKDQEVRSLSTLLNDKSNELESERNGNAEKLSAASTKIDSLVQGIADLESEKSRREEDIERLKISLKDKEAEIVTVTQQTSVECERKCTELKQMMEIQVENMRSHSEEEKNQIVEELLLKISSFENAVAERDSEAENLKEIIAEKTIKLEEVHAKESQLTEELNCERMLLQQQIKKSDELSVENEETSKKFAEKCSEVETLSSALEISRQEFETFSRQKNEDFSRLCQESQLSGKQLLEEKLAAAKCKFDSELRESSGNFSCKIANLEEALERHLSEKESLKLVLEEKDEIIGGLKNQASATDASLLTEKKLAEEMKEQIETLSQERELKRMEFEKLLNKVSDLETMSKLKSEELGQEQEEVRKTHKDQLNQMTTEFQLQMNDAAKTFESRISALQEEKSFLVSQLEQTSNGEKTIKEEFEKLRNESEAMQKQHQDELLETKSSNEKRMFEIVETHESNISSLKSELEEKVRQLTSKVSDLESDNFKLLSEIERLTSLLLERESSTHRLQDECLQLRQSHQEEVQQLMTQHLTQVEAAKKEFDSKISALESESRNQIEQLCVALTEKTDELAEFQKQSGEDQSQLLERLKLSAEQLQAMSERVVSFESELQLKCNEVNTLMDKEVMSHARSEELERHFKESQDLLQNTFEQKLQEQNQDYELKVRQLQEENNSNASNFQAKCQEAESLNAAMSSKLEEIEALNVLLSQKSAEKNYNDSKFQEKCQEIESLNAAMSGKSEEIEALNGLLIRKSEEVDVLAKKLDAELGEGKVSKTEMENSLKEQRKKYEERMVVVSI